MKKFLSFYFGFLFLTIANAQPTPLVLDQEKLFTADEVSRLDSMLHAYRQSSGHFVVVVSTDTLDVSPEEYIDRLAKSSYSDNTENSFGYFLLLSRKNQLVFCAVNDNLKPFISQDLLLDILNAGLPSLKEKRTAEGVMMICRRAMEFLDRLPKK